MAAPSFVNLFDNDKDQAENKLRDEIARGLRGKGLDIVPGDVEDETDRKYAYQRWVNRRSGGSHSTDWSASLQKPPHPSFIQRSGLAYP